jgi:DNA polymerase I-like protein with 3'-5' exonuclease and polymerase domains
LPKRHKQIIKSRFLGGKIYQVDFVSLEPRVARLATGQPADHDVYTQLSKDLFSSTLTREQCKIAVLCALYGASKSKLSKMIGNDHNPTSVIKKIQHFFGVDEILKSVRPNLKKHASFRNYFGRQISPDRNDNSALVNYYIQSSAVDAAMIGFAAATKKINKKYLKCVPIFVIHDAILFDVHPDHKKEFFNIFHNGINIPTLGEFPVTISAIADGGE